MAGGEWFARMVEIELGVFPDGVSYFLDALPVVSHDDFRYAVAHNEVAGFLRKYGSDIRHDLAPFHGALWAWGEGGNFGAGWADAMMRRLERLRRQNPELSDLLDVWAQRFAEGKLDQRGFDLLMGRSGPIRSIGITGHRNPPSTGSLWLDLQKMAQTARLQGTKTLTVHHGGARGTDLSAAEWAIANGHKVHTHLPHPFNVHTRGWPAVDKARLQNVLSVSERITTVSPRYNVGNYQVRNERIVNESQMMMSKYDGRSRGGTVNTLRYAREQGRITFNSPGNVQMFKRPQTKSQEVYGRDGYKPPEE